MAHNDELKQRLERLTGLVGELESIADPKARASARDLISLVMDLHGEAFERILEQMFAQGEAGERIIGQLASDPLVSSLLVLYGLHPDDLGTRATAAVARACKDLKSHGVSAELISADDGTVRVQATVAPGSCGSTTMTARKLLENAIYDAAPDLSSVVIEGLEGKQPSGFVSLRSLLPDAPGDSQPSHGRAGVLRESAGD